MTELIRQIWQLLTTRWDFFAGLLAEHLQISLLAILIAVAVGGLAGVLISEYRRLARPTLGVVNFLYTIPSISMLGFLIPFSGVGNATAVIALTVYALLPMVRNTYTGMTNVEPAVLEAARGMGSTRLQVLYKVKLPLALPVVLSGVRSMATMTIALAGIASFIGAGGLGVAIYRGVTTNNAAMTMAGSLLIAVLALAVDLLLGFAGRRMKLRSARAKRTNRVLAAAALACCLGAGAAALLPARGADTLRIATKPMTEQYVLGEMLDLLIEQDTGLNVELTQGVGGGTSNIQPAMENGEFDLYPEYTGTAWNMVLKNTGLYTEARFPELQQAYEDGYGMQWLGMYGFNNTYGMVVRRQIAEQYGLRTYSDLAAVAGQLTFGAVDGITRGQLQNELQRIHRQTGITVLFVTHDIAEALKLGTRVLVLDAGGIQQFAPPQELLQHPATGFVRRLTEQQRRTCSLPDDRLGDCAYSGAACPRA